MSELKELCWMIYFMVLCVPVVLYGIGYILAKSTYKAAQKKQKNIKRNIKARKSLVTCSNIVFDVDNKNKTLQEIQAERAQIMRILGGI